MSPPPGAKIRVLIVEDHAVVREGLRMLLEREGDMEVVGEAEDGDGALGSAERLGPDTVLMDLSLRADNDGALYIRRLLALRPGLKVIVLSSHTKPTFVEDAFEAGAAGYLSKGACFDEVAAAIRAVHRGGTFLSAALSRSAGAAARAIRAQRPSRLDALTEREREVLVRLAAGRSSKQAALDLGISSKTVDTHRRKLMQKLRVESVAELTRIAILEGLVPI